MKKATVTATASGRIKVTATMRKPKATATMRKPKATARKL